MACHLVGAKPLSEPMLEYFNRTLRNKLLGNLNRNSYIFFSRKCTWKCRQENGGHFVSASMCQKHPSIPGRAIVAFCVSFHNLLVYQRFYQVAINTRRGRVRIDFGCTQGHVENTSSNNRQQTPLEFSGRKRTGSNIFCAQAYGRYMCKQFLNLMLLNTNLYSRMESFPQKNGSVFDIRLIFHRKAVLHMKLNWFFLIMYLCYRQSTLHLSMDVKVDKMRLITPSLVMGCDKYVTIQNSVLPVRADYVPGS